MQAPRPRAAGSVLCFCEGNRVLGQDKAEKGRSPETPFFEGQSANDSTVQLLLLSLRGLGM